jgi:hypothetical protein
LAEPLGSENWTSQQSEGPAFTEPVKLGVICLIKTTIMVVIFMPSITFL